MKCGHAPKIEINNKKNNKMFSKKRVFNFKV